MKEERFTIRNIPSLLYGDSSENLFLYIHGKMGRKEEAAHIAEIVYPKGYQVLSIDLPGHGERTGEMECFVPWKVVPELQAVYANTQKRWKRISLYARFALPHSTIMIHQPSGGAQGQATEIQIVADHIAQTKRTLNELLAANTGQPIEVVERDTDRDNYMTAEEAKAYGLIDGVVMHK